MRVGSLGASARARKVTGAIKGHKATKAPPKTTATSKPRKAVKRAPAKQEE